MEGKAKDIATLIGGFLTAVMVFLATLNIKYEWLTEDSISALTAVIVAAILLVTGLIATWKNTYVSKKGKQQEEYLKAKGLK